MSQMIGIGIGNFGVATTANFY